jgi:4-carboxymuconolactone decarboxylase
MTAMDERERFELGTKKRRKVLGDAWVDRSNAKKTEFNAEFLDLISRYAWGEIWTRPGLDDRTRRLLVIGSMIALGRWEEFKLHLRAALVEGGVPKNDIKEVIMQQAIYCGVPAANTAFHAAEATFAEIEKGG